MAAHPHATCFNRLRDVSISACFPVGPLALSLLGKRRTSAGAMQLGEEGGFIEIFRFNHPGFDVFMQALTP
jgi:hypothetical protein